MSLPIFQVDAFTSKAFGGNPAAVCLLPKAAEDGWMQTVAAEMNVSETAFLVRRVEGFDLRWFTPAVEVELCGHATLASAHTLWEEGHLRPDEEARFFTQSGLLTAMRRHGWIEMDFPAQPEQRAEAPPELLQALGVAPEYVGKNGSDYLVEVRSEADVRSLRPDLARLRTIAARGVIVTAASDSPEFDFVSRFFGPAVGIDEDPVTGSAHCCLAPFWQKRLGKDDMVGYQASSRGGVVRVRPKGERVILAGEAVTTLRGELLP